MKSKFKTLLLLAAVIPSAGVLTGCGQTVDNRPGFTFWHVYSKEAEARILKQISEFEQIIKDRDGISIKVRVSKLGDYASIKTKLQDGGFSTGNIPTLAVAYPDHVASYMEKGRSAGNPEKYVWKLDDFFDDPEIGFGKQADLFDDPDNPTDFFPAYLDEGRHYIEEGTYSLPFAKSTELMYYNEPLVDKYLDAYPAAAGQDHKEFLSSLNWNDFVSFCSWIREDLNRPDNSKIVQIKDKSGKHIKYPSYVAGYDSDANMFITRLVQQGINYSSLDSNKHGVVGFAKDVSKTDYNKVVADLKGLRTLHQDGVLITKKTNDDKYTSNLFTEQDTIFTIGSSGGSDYNTPKGNGFNVGVTKVPGFGDSPKYVSQGVTFAFLKNPTLSEEKNTENVRYAWQFMKYITNVEQNLLFCNDSQGYFPVRQSALETETWEELCADTTPSAAAYKCIVNEVKHQYFNTALFQGCAELREEVGSLLAQALIDKDGTDESIGALIDKSVEEARKYIK